MCYYLQCRCCTNQCFYHFWNSVVLLEIIRMSVWMFAYNDIVYPVKQELGVGRIGLTVSYVYYTFLILTYLIYFMSLCCPTRSTPKYCVAFAHKMLLWMTFWALLVDNVLYLINDKYYCPEVPYYGQQPPDVMDDMGFKRVLRGSNFDAPSYDLNAGYQGAPAAEPEFVAPSHTKNSFGNNDPAPFRSRDSRPTSTFQDPYSAQPPWWAKYSQAQEQSSGNS